MNCIQAKRAACICKGFAITAVVVGTLALAVTALALAVIFAPPFGAAFLSIGIATYIAIGSGATVALATAAAVALFKKSTHFETLAKTLENDFSDIEKLVSVTILNNLSFFNKSEKEVLKEIPSAKDKFDGWFDNFIKQNSVEMMEYYLGQIMNEEIKLPTPTSNSTTKSSMITNDFQSNFRIWFLTTSLIKRKLQPVIHKNILPKLKNLNINSPFPEKGFDIYSTLYNISRQINN